MSTEIENWAKKYEDLTNGDDTIKAMAKYYTFKIKCFSLLML